MKFYFFLTFVLFNSNLTFAQETNYILCSDLDNTETIEAFDKVCIQNIDNNEFKIDLIKKNGNINHVDDTLRATIIGWNIIHAKRQYLFHIGDMEGKDSRIEFKASVYGPFYDNKLLSLNSTYISIHHLENGLVQNKRKSPRTIKKPHNGCGGRGRCI